MTVRGGRRRDWYRLLLAVVILSRNVDAGKQKRQIFREQVLPALGGKIPEEAFRTDRLALNRLNKDGITVPDGVVLDARHIHKHPHAHPDQRMPEIIKVYLTSDSRYVSPEGRFHYNHPKAVDTTYIIRKPFTHTNHKATNHFDNVQFRSYMKPQTYSNYRQLVPIRVPPPVKAGIYKPVVSPLILPVDANLFGLSSWKEEYHGEGWETIYQPFDDYFVDETALFDSHQIIADYQGFLDEFHGRSLRRADAKINMDGYRRHRRDGKYRESKPPSATSNRRKITLPNIADSHNSIYTGLTNVPKTNFSCGGRKGMFADIETKCQVFHNCSDWSRTSSLCPPGTAFCETSKRCRWFGTVHCGQ